MYIKNHFPCDIINKVCVAIGQVRNYYVSALAYVCVRSLMKPVTRTDSHTCGCHMDVCVCLCICVGARSSLSLDRVRIRAAAGARIIYNMRNCGGWGVLHSRYTGDETTVHTAERLFFDNCPMLYLYHMRVIGYVFLFSL